MSKKTTIYWDFFKKKEKKKSLFRVYFVGVGVDVDVDVDGGLFCLL